MRQYAVSWISIIRATNVAQAKKITDHMNEAMNPCHYGWVMRSGIARGVHKRAHDWLTFYHMTPEQLEQHTKSLTTWFGEDYGYYGDDVIIVSKP